MSRHSGVCGRHGHPASVALIPRPMSTRHRTWTCTLGGDDTPNNDLVVWRAALLQQAQALGVNTSDFDTTVFAYPPLDCFWAGLGLVGCFRPGLGNVCWVYALRLSSCLSMRSIIPSVRQSVSLSVRTSVHPLSGHTSGYICLSLFACITLLAISGSLGAKARHPHQRIHRKDPALIKLCLLRSIVFFRRNFCRKKVLHFEKEGTSVLRLNLSS
jgi:hypothetical protein